MDQGGAKRALSRPAQQRLGAGGDCAQSIVPAHAAEPISRVAKVRLPPVHDAMDERAVSCFNFLGNMVGGIEMVMPEQHQSADKILALCGQSGARQNGLQLLVDLGLRLHAGASFGTEGGKLRGGKQLFEGY